MEARNSGKISFPPATPARPVPGAFLNTPAMPRTQTPSADPVRRRLFTGAEAAAGGGTAAPGTGPSSSNANVATVPRPRAKSSRSRTSTATTGWQAQQAQQAQQEKEQNLDPIIKAARWVNHFLRVDDTFPEIDTYCRQGASSDYDVPGSDSSWTPFHKTHMYPIPNQIFDHYNSGRLQTLMGLFAEINHAWVAIDNSLFLWDYTNPDPELVGYEQQPNPIQAVALVAAKPGVFVASITHVLVVATSDIIVVLGVSAQRDAAGVMRVSLYDTNVSTGIRGQDVRIIKGSADGRIYFGGGNDIDLYELYYRKDEGFFFSRCGKFNHTNPRWILAVVGSLKAITSRGYEYLVDIVVDDTRNLVYTLSSTSTIRTYYVESAWSVVEAITKDRNNILRDTSHMIHPSPLLSERTNIISINPIASNESSRIHLMALTDTGCRLFLSATSIASYTKPGTSGGAPQSMQVHFIKFPPSARPRGKLNAAEGATTDVASTALSRSRFGGRFAPGFFLDFVCKANMPNVDLLFVSAPETGRIQNTPSTVPVRYQEHANWIELGSKAEAVGLITKPFAAAEQPLGFGNELAVQFDDPPSEFAILTNTGVHVVRRRRLVDIFAAVIRSTVGVESLEAEARRFTQLYGRVETVTTALAVACGHGTDARLGGPRASDRAAEDRARQVFVDFGGHPTIQERDGATLTMESVKLSSRHDGLATYVGRLVRMLWKAKIVLVSTPSGITVVGSTVPTAKLQSVQENLQRLRRFLDANRGLIQGLSGPADLQNASNRQDEFAMQSEHQALHALEKLMEGISEGISFVLMLFEERVSDIYIRLDDTAKGQLRDLTYESLFSESTGKDIARILVRAIVNRNIETGANVETVADALRRRCGSFCSPDDVVIFKAQEQLQRAMEHEATSNNTATRTLLLESLRLFERVAGSLTLANLRAAVTQYITLRYFAGAVQLCLVCAHEKDRGNTVAVWMREGRPAGDPRAAVYKQRRRCYELIHDVLARLDEVAAQEPETVDGRLTLMATKRLEAYDVVNSSDDEAFHFGLYEWYIQQGWTDRILAIDSPHVVTFLQQLTAAGPQHAELLCRFYTNRSRFYDAGRVQLELANSDFDIGIKERITLLSRAKANAGVATSGVSRQEQQQLAHEVSDLLDVAHIQDDLLERLLVDERMEPGRRQEIKQVLNGRIRDLTDLFNNYADQACYYDLCLLIYHSANYRNTITIAGTWTSLIQAAHDEAEVLGQDGNRDAPQPYEHVSSRVQAVANRTSLDSFVFPIATLLPELCRYSVVQAQDGRVGADPNWPVRLFLTLGVSYDLIARVLEELLDRQDGGGPAGSAGGGGTTRARAVELTLCVVEAWIGEAKRRGGMGGVMRGRTGAGSIGSGGSPGTGQQQQQQQQQQQVTGMGQWVADLLQRCEGALPSTGEGANANVGGADVAELRRLARSLRRDVATLVERGSLGGIGMGSMRFV